MRAGKSLSRHSRKLPPCLAPNITANFIDDERFAVTWIINNPFGENPGIQYIFDCFAPESEAPVASSAATTDGAPSSMGLAGRIDSGKHGRFCLYHPGKNTLEIRSADHSEDTKAIGLPFAKASSIHIDPGMTRAVFLRDAPREGGAGENAGLVLWDIENGRHVLAYDLRDVSAGSAWLMDVNFALDRMIVCERERRRLMVFSIEDGRLIFEKGLPETYLAKCMPGGLIFVSGTNRNKYRYIDPDGMQTLNSIEKRDGDHGGPTVEFVSGGSVLFRCPASGGKYGYELKQAPYFGFKADWSLSRIKPSAESIEDDARFEGHFALAGQAYEKDDIAGAATNLKAARAVAGYRNNPACIALQKQVMLFCRPVKIDGVLKSPLQAQLPGKSYYWKEPIAIVPRFGYLSTTVGISGQDDETMIFDLDSCAFMHRTAWRMPIYSRDGLRVFAMRHDSVSRQDIDSWAPPSDPDERPLEDSYARKKLVGLHDLKQDFKANHQLPSADIEIKGLRVSPSERLYALVYSFRPNKRHSAMTERFRVYDADTNELAFSYDNSISTMFQDFSEDSNYILLARKDESSANKELMAEIVDVRTGKTEARIGPPLVSGMRFVHGGTGILAPSLERDRLLLYGLSGKAPATLCDYTGTGKTIKAHDMWADGGKAAVIAGNSLDFWDIASGALLSSTDIAEGIPRALCVSENGDRAVVLASEGPLLYDIDWELDFPGWAEWDEGAGPYLKAFLENRPAYTEDDFRGLMRTLQSSGYGWLTPGGIRAKLSEMGRL